MKKISLVVPCYNEEEVIEKFFDEVLRVKKTMPKVDFERQQCMLV